MERMKLLVTKKLTDKQLESLNTLSTEFPDLTISYSQEKDIIEEEFLTADLVWGERIYEDQVEKARNLKMFFFSYTGVDKLPFDLLGRHKIQVSNVHTNAPFVAERALALTLALLGKIPANDRDFRKDIWHGWVAGENLSSSWRSLFNRRCTILGTGEIGKWIARLLAPFGCTIRGFKLNRTETAVEGFDSIVYSLEDALTDCEVLFVALPLTTSTTEMIAEKELKLLSNAVIVNIGRSEVINEKALFKALEQNQLKGAALDVWYSYPKSGETVHPPSSFPFKKLENVVLSSHMGGYTEEAIEASVEETIGCIREYLSTGTTRFTVDVEKQY